MTSSYDSIDVVLREVLKPAAFMDWNCFSSEYSKELQSKTRYLDWAKVPQSARDANWFGFEPATESLIRETEERLRITLPIDLTTFYLVTNGWMFCSTIAYDIKPVQCLNYLPASDPELCSLCDGLINPSTSDPELQNARYIDEFKVLRSISLNTSGDDTRLLFDSDTTLPAEELRYGTWTSWHPGMK